MAARHRLGRERGKVAGKYERARGEGACGEDFVRHYVEVLISEQVGKNQFDGKVMIFFTSYSVSPSDSRRGLREVTRQQIITGMVLLNVVVAVLLDNFTRSVAQEDQASRVGLGHVTSLCG